MTRSQRRVLERMADGAVITVNYHREWVLKMGNDEVRLINRPLRRALRQNQWTHESYGDLCYRITPMGRAALGDQR